MLNRLFVATVFAGSMVSALASFDLMFLPNATDSSVARLDPISGAGLGGFAVGGAIRMMDYLPSTGKFYGYLNSGRLHTYDPWTGIRTATESLTTNSKSFAMEETGTYGWFIDSTGVVRRLNVATGSETTPAFPTTITSLVSLTRIPGNRMVLTGLSATGDIVACIFDALGGEFSSAKVTKIRDVSLFTPGSLGVQPAYSASRNSIFVPYRTTSVSTFTSTEVIISNTGLVPSSVRATNMIDMDTTRTPILLPAHDGFYAVGRDATEDLFRVTECDGTGLRLRSFKTSFGWNTNINRGAMVLAPEPGSAVLLASGLAFIARRRRSR